MNGSLLGRGRAGRLAVYAGSIAVLILLVFAYRAAVSEMTRLRDLYEQCSTHQESLQQRFQVIFDYKMRLEKSLADETSANAAVKQELQQRATREKTRRDKDSEEAMQRYNSLQQLHKTLQTENQDLKEECDRIKKQATADAKGLEATVQSLRSELERAKEDKLQSLEHLKNKYLAIDVAKTKLDEKYDKLVRENADAVAQSQRFEKQIFQLNRELEYSKRSARGARPASPSSFANPDVVAGGFESKNENSGTELKNVGGAAGGGEFNSQDSVRLARPPPAQQSASTTTTTTTTTTTAAATTSTATPRTMSDSKRALSKDFVASNAGNKFSVHSGEKNHSERTKVQKLPLGVVPIPKMFDSEKKSVPAVEGYGNNDNNNNNNNNNNNMNNEKRGANGGFDNAKVILEKNKQFENVVGDRDENDKNVGPDSPRVNLLVNNLRGRQDPGEIQQSILGRQDKNDWSWQRKVPPGVQEVGEDPNNLEKIPEIEDTGNHPIGDGVEYGQYEGGDYDKELPMKSNDLHIEEGEDEGEDEDDPMDYNDGNNLKVNKHPE